MKNFRIFFYFFLLLTFGCNDKYSKNSYINGNKVEYGIDALAQSDFNELKGKNIGIITNNAATDSNGIQTWKQIASNKEIKLIALFAPEHGISVNETDEFNDTLEPENKIKVFSLFGDTRAPTDEMLKGIDTLIFDIPSIGVRYYTYEATLGMAMESASRNDISFIVLDRPNPINGISISGPSTDRELINFNSYFPTPIRHGMTIGELALFHKADKNLNLKLKIIKTKNWKREDYFSSSGQNWIPTSPNIRTAHQALLYSGIVILENSNVSVGRGTDTPFEVIGAPWINSDALLRYLNQEKFPGIEIEFTTFTPQGKVPYSGELCFGVKFKVTNENDADPLKFALTVAVFLRDKHSDIFNSKSVSDLFFNKKTAFAFISNASRDEILLLWRNDIENFSKSRQNYLLY